MVSDTISPHCTPHPVHNNNVESDNDIPQLVEVQQGAHNIKIDMHNTPLNDRGSDTNHAPYGDIRDDPLIDRGQSTDHLQQDHLTHEPEPENSLHWFATTVLAAQTNPIQDLLGNHHLLVSKVHPNTLRQAVDNYRSGNISQFLKNWEQLTSDREIISTVKYGLKLNTMSAISPRQPCQFKLSVDESRAIDEEILPMLQKGIIELSEETPKDYFSPIFPRTKKTGDTRVILNLKSLNKNILSKHFKMESIRNVKHMIRKDCWMGSS